MPELEHIARLCTPPRAISLAKDLKGTCGAVGYYDGQAFDPAARVWEGETSVIYIERLPAPQDFTLFAERQGAVAAEFYALPVAKRKQRRFKFEDSDTLRRAAFEGLVFQFNGKCAYCESLFAEHIDRFRPRAGVAESTGGYLGDHYWRQAFAWENLYLVCASCNRHKGNRFPVSGKRAPADATREQLRGEVALLLDPCESLPQDHLLFTADGRVSGKTEVGRITIEVFALNRTDLVRDRELEGRKFAALRSQAQARGRGKDGAELEAMLEPHAPYLALKRAMLEEWQGGGGSDDRSQTLQAQRSYDVRKEDASTESAAGLKKFRSRARFIERVEIRNIAGIDKLSLDLSGSKAEGAPCLAVLGTNGVGKSTVLKCIALALAGPKHRVATGVKARSFVKHGRSTGQVTVHLSGFEKPVEMTVNRATGTFKFQQEKSRAAILAYGSSRLLPTERNRPRPIRRSKAEAAARIGNLFDPFLPMTDVSKWLSSLSRDRFDEAATVIKELLAIDSNLTLVHPTMKAQPVMVRAGRGHPQPFSSLSDGYQSMLGLAADLMQSMHQLGFESMRSAQAVVLIDELGNHLHPSWRMRVVKSLRQAFPQVQFIFSTHDPLCLKGLLDGEVVALRRDAKGRVFTLENLPSVQGLRVDQLLTSDHFGLESAIDPETDDAVRRYLELSRKPEALTRSEDLELERLKAHLTQTRLLGQTWREQAMLQALDATTMTPATDAASIDVKAQSAETIEMLKRLAAAADPEAASKGV